MGKPIDIGAILLGVVFGAVITEFTENRPAILETLPLFWAIVIATLIAGFLFVRGITISTISNPLGRAGPEIAAGFSAWMWLRG